MGVGEFKQYTSSHRVRRPGPRDLRIIVQGELSAEVLVELEGFGVRAAQPGLLLFGSIPDQAALGGTLRRLHAAGLVITAVEFEPHPEDRDTLRPTPPTPRGVPSRHLAHIEVEGTAPAGAANLPECVGRRDNPSSTTLMFQIHDNGELMVALDALEDWGLPLRRLVTDS